MGKLAGNATAMMNASMAAFTPVVVTAGSSKSEQEVFSSASKAIVSDVKVGGDLIITATDGSINSQGTNFDVKQDAILEAKDNINLGFVTDKQEQSSTNNRSGFSLDNRNWIMPIGAYKDNGEAGKQQDKVTGTKLTVGGSSLMRTKKGDINVLGSQVVAEGDNLIDSAKDVNVFSSQNSQSQHDNQKSRGFGSVQISDTERFDGFMKSHKDENSNDIEQVKSVIKSNKGDTVIHAKGDYKQRVADIGAGKDIEVVAKSIEVLADYNSGSKHTDNKDAKLGQFTKVSSPIIDAVNAIEGAVKSDASDKVKTLQGISAAATTYQAVSAVQNGATLAKVESGIGRNPESASKSQ